MKINITKETFLEGIQIVSAGTSASVMGLGSRSREERFVPPTTRAMPIAIPEEAAIPWYITSLRISRFRGGERGSDVAESFFIETSVNQVVEGFYGIFRIGTGSGNDKFGAAGGGKHEHAHEAFAVCGFRVLRNGDVAVEFRGGLNKKGRRSRMKTQFVFDDALNGFCGCSHRVSLSFKFYGSYNIAFFPENSTERSGKFLNSSKCLKIKELQLLTVASILYRSGRIFTLLGRAAEALEKRAPRNCFLRNLRRLNLPCSGKYGNIQYI